MSQPPTGGRKYRFKDKGSHGVVSWGTDHTGRLYASHADTPGVHYLVDQTELKRGADAKRAFILRQHVEAFVQHHGREHTVFFTTTDKDGVTPKEYGKRWNSLLTNESDWISGFVRVLEPMKNGRPHFHNLTAVEFDTQPDAFDWEAFTLAQSAYHAKDWQTFRAKRAAYVASAAPELRELWAWSRKAMDAYGLGRAEILPVRKQGAISEYIGKYLDKGMTLKVDAWKGVRRFETDRRSSAVWKRCGSRFSWASPGAALWRARVADVAFATGCDIQSGDISQIKRKLGSRWAYQLRGAMMTAEAREWRHTCEVLAHQCGNIKVSVEYDNGENAAW